MTDLTGKIDGKFYKEYNKNVIKYANSYENIQEQIKDIDAKPSGLEALIFNPLTELIRKPISNYIVDNFYNNKDAYHTVAKVLPQVFKYTNSLEVIGAEENIPKIGDNGFVVVANHQYHLDPFFTSCAFSTREETRKIRWISKQGNFEDPLFRPILNLFGTIPLFNKRNNHGKSYGADPNISYVTTNKSQEEIKKTLKDKEGVGIFPEGTRNRYFPHLLVKEFQIGAAVICSGGLGKEVETSPYIPVGLSGVRQPGKGKVTIRVGEPVYLDESILDVRDKSKLKDASECMRQQVIALIKGEEVPKNKYEV